MYPRSAHIGMSLALAALASLGTDRPMVRRIVPLPEPEPDDAKARADARVADIIADREAREARRIAREESQRAEREASPRYQAAKLKRERKAAKRLVEVSRINRSTAKEA